MHEYTIARSTRHCRLSNRDLKPGERYYSVIVLEDGESLRYDISETMWQGPPPNTVGWWRNEMPPPAPKKRRPTPNKELLDRLAELCDDPSQAILAHLLGLLLLRRRVLRTEDDADSIPTENLTNIAHPQPHEAALDDAPIVASLNLFHPATHRQFVLPALELTSDDLERYDEQLQSMLFVEVSDDEKIASEPGDREGHGDSDASL